MTESTKKRTLDSFFKPAPAKKPRLQESSSPPTNHATYPFPVPQLPDEIVEILRFTPAADGEVINDQPDLDLLYFEPYIQRDTANELFQFLRNSLFFYRVKYTIKRGSVTTEIVTPRYTTVFGVDDTARFAENGTLCDSKNSRPLPLNTYKCKPRPIPTCLDVLRKQVEGATGATFNFCLVNYYAAGSDSISYHSDDEAFLGPDPAIASLSLGITRDFYLKHRSSDQADGQMKKFALKSGDMVLMRGQTQKHWLHSIPKRKAGEVGKGRINITFRKAMVKGGTENYYTYNVGNGPVYKWNIGGKEMRLYADHTA